MIGTVISERLTGVPQETYKNFAMEWGTATEPEARKAYQFDKMIKVEQVGFVLHPHISDAGASPDGLVAERGLVEIKCPNTSTHIETLLSHQVPKRYVTQMQWQMACCERAWCDYVSFDPRLPEHMQLFVTRLYRNDTVVAALERLVTDFLREVDGRILALEALYKKGARE
jgi:putative phage-type endonuclease